MANILALKLFKIKDSRWHLNHTRQSPEERYAVYSQMKDLLIASAQKYLKDLDEVVIFEGETDSITKLFEEHAKFLVKLTKEGNNVLYMDLDCLFIKPVEIFDKFDKFSMFNGDLSWKRYPQFPVYNYCGVRYYPAEHDFSIWKPLHENKWDHSTWDYEQKQYNEIMYSQDNTLETYYNPSLAYQYGINMNNRIPFEEAKILVFHGSRGPAKVLEWMKEFYKTHIGTD